MYKRKINWAHSILNDPSSTPKEKFTAETILRKLDPEGLQDHCDDIIRTRGQFDG